VLGLSSSLEGEEMNLHLKRFLWRDRTEIGLPEIQEKLMKEVVALASP